MSRPDQDWETVVIQREKTKEEKIKSGEVDTVRRQQTANSHTVTVSKKLANDFDPENIQKVATSTHELGQAIASARSNLKSRSNPDRTMTQSELDQVCQFPKNTVRDYENGTGKIVSGQLNTLNRVLGVVLPRPKK